MLQTASAPMVEMTRDLLQAQKEELNKERLRLEAVNKELSKLANDAAARAQYASAEEQLAKINSEFVLKDKQINEALTEQKKRQRQFLDARIAKRKANKAKK